MSRDNAYLLDIINACTTLSNLILGLSFEELIDDEIRQYAVLYKLTVLGEASRRLSNEIRELDTDQLFARVIAQRNIVVHRYDSVDWSLIWESLTVSVPELHAFAAGLLEQLTKDAQPATES
jgi:uncharacterized protein with HEPN domain